MDTCSTPAKGKPRGKRRPDMTFSLAVAHPEPAAASYPSMDAALRAAKPFILHLYHRWMRDWLDRVLCAQGRGLDPGQIAAALGLTADEVDFYLNPRVVRALREVW